MREEYRLIAILRNIQPENVCDIVDILLQEGVRCMEVSLSEPNNGFGCLEALRARYSDDSLLLGAGTVSTKAEVDRLHEIGIRFFVTPGFDGELVDYALKKGMDVVPGVLVPSDVQQAKNRGLSLVKMFPANAFPMQYLKALKGPFPGMDFLAVGGVSPETIGDYQKAGYVGVGIGSSLVPQQAGPSHHQHIRAAAKQCVLAFAQK